MTVIPPTSMSRISRKAHKLLRKLTRGLLGSGIAKNSPRAQRRAWAFVVKEAEQKR